jgi:prolyl-tRNA synthetase
MDIQQEFIFAVVRGDMELNEIKLANEIKAMELRPATEDEIISIGSAPGFASPVGFESA